MGTADRGPQVAKSVFYSFHYDHDVHRIQLVRNMDALEAQPILNPQKWEEVERGGERSIKTWIHNQMAYKKAVIVLIGKHTGSRPWVIYEIEAATELPRHPLRSSASADMTRLDTPANL